MSSDFKKLLEDKHTKNLTSKRNSIISNAHLDNKFLKNIYKDRPTNTKLEEFSQLENSVKNNICDFSNSKSKNIKALYHFFQSLIIIILIYPNLCSYNISLTTIEIKESIYYPILNIKIIISLFTLIIKL